MANILSATARWGFRAPPSDSPGSWLLFVSNEGSIPAIFNLLNVQVTARKAEVKALDLSTLDGPLLNPGQSMVYRLRLLLEGDGEDFKDYSWNRSWREGGFDFEAEQPNLMISYLVGEFNSVPAVQNAVIDLKG